MRTSTSSAGLVLLALLLVSADDPLGSDKTLQRADERYQAAVGKAQEEFQVLKSKEAEKRLKIYRTALEQATKSGDFDKATALKARISAMEADGPRPRPKDVVKFGGHTYALIPDKVTWHVAKRRCEEMGGHLVTIESGDEDAFIRRLCASTPAWGGASDEDEEGNMRWLTGETVNIADSLFDNFAEHEHCLMYWPPFGKWTDATSGVRYSCICEWNQP